MLKPGRTTGEVARAVEAELGRQGVPSWRRGHFGHGVGLSVFSEQWPYISASTDDPIEAGMVLAFEVPLYIEGVASFNLEDQFLITADGAVSMNRLPRKLGVIGLTRRTRPVTALLRCLTNNLSRGRNPALLDLDVSPEALTFRQTFSQMRAAALATRENRE